MSSTVMRVCMLCLGVLVTVVGIDRTVHSLTFSAFYRPPSDIDTSSTHPHIRWGVLKTVNSESVDIVHVDPPNQTSSVCVLYSHGNAEHVHNSSLVNHLVSLSERTGCSVVGYDYVGYGAHSRSEWCSERRCMHSIEVAYGYVCNQFERVVLVGWSLGTASTLRLSMRMLGRRQHKIASVILLSPLVSAIRTKSAALGAVFWWADIFDHVAYMNSKSCPAIADTSVPFVCIHGTSDTIVPCHHTKLVHNMLRRKTPNVSQVYMKDVGHRIPIHEVVKHIKRAIKKII
jgi:pimeloyl-ACP methyl ester carboxylesterase